MRREPDPEVLRRFVYDPIVFLDRNKRWAFNAADLESAGGVLKAVVRYFHRAMRPDLPATYLAKKFALNRETVSRYLEGVQSGAAAACDPAPKRRFSSAQTNEIQHVVTSLCQSDSKSLLPGHSKSLRGLAREGMVANAKSERPPAIDTGPAIDLEAINDLLREARVADVKDADLALELHDYAPEDAAGGRKSKAAGGKTGGRPPAHGGAGGPPLQEHTQSVEITTLRRGLYNTGLCTYDEFTEAVGRLKDGTSAREFIAGYTRPAVEISKRGAVGYAS